MNKKILSLIVLFMYVAVSFSQNELNGYKYIVIPKKYDFLKGEDDKYKLNSLTKFLFNKNGFNALFQDEDYPEDLRLNTCLGLVVYVINDSKVFTTRLKIELRDCYNKTVYTSIEGKSREKDYEKAYQEALRGAFVSLEVMSYNFDPALITNLSIVSNTNIPENNVDTETKAIPEKEPEVVNSPEPVPVVVVAKPIEEEKIEVSNTDQPEPKELEAQQTEAAVIVESTPVPVVIPVETDIQEEADATNANSMLRSYKNENISFFIIEQDEKLVAYVNETKDGIYKKGELIGTFIKTSIPNVYRVTWKDKEGKKNETTGYFDDAGNLKIDVNRDGKIEVVIFEIEK